MDFQLLQMYGKGTLNEPNLSTWLSEHRLDIPKIINGDLSDNIPFAVKMSLVIFPGEGMFRTSIPIEKDGKMCHFTGNSHGFWAVVEIENDSSRYDWYCNYLQSDALF